MKTETKQYINMDLKTITKNIKKITNKVSNSRPILQNMYLDNNIIVATDSHRLIKINYEHDQTNQLIDPKTNEIVESDNQYPNTERIIPLTKDTNNIINIKSDEIDLIISVLKAYKHLKVSKLQLTLNEDNSQYELNINYFELIEFNNANLKKINLSYKLENNQLTNNKVQKLYLKLDYFLHALEFLKDYDKATMLNNDYKIHVYDRLRPIMITTDKNDFQYVICPLREY
ncbi:hypothetical protein [Mammaliicoccus lentus]|uniref:hypothetical protein n=1 Tax=Mammaliicoccus lentus TaxID=42858 RepID=UPI001072E165|nr:hypothetical protein [Mammaliicoccus lentus]MBF0793391.1 hypothetical protein [Mammaliicoccus lentus]TFV17892.1 hypothetical protein E4T78_01910 [Mammaliicoccus lentus]